MGTSITHVVGYYAGLAGFNSYIETGTSFVLAHPPGSLSSYLNAINASGLAVGGYCQISCSTAYGGQHGYTYQLGSGAITTIGFPGSEDSTAAYGINDLGQIVGGYCPGSPGGCPEQFNPTQHGFLDDHGVFTKIDYPGAQWTNPYSINNQGQIVGQYQSNKAGLHGFLYARGTYTSINFPGANYTTATAINNSGVIAGLFQDKGFRNHGYLYANGVFTQVDVPGASATQVTGINDRNDLVGIWFRTIGTQPFVGFPTGSQPVLKEDPVKP